MTQRVGGCSPGIQDRPVNFRGGAVVDFAHVPTRQDAIHLRLEHWAMWVRVREQPWKMQPIFRNYRPPRDDADAVASAVVSINLLEAYETERAVSWLPEPHRTVIRWAYVFPHIPPGKVVQACGLTKQAVASRLIDGRDMLKNRLAQKLVDKG